MVGYLFAGQGAQYVGMGEDLYQSFPESKQIFDSADKVLGFSVSKLCFKGPQEELKRTVNCQPAILTMSIAAWKAFRKVTSGKLQVTSYTAGLSLGEYSALVAAEAISFEDAVYLVRSRGQFMEEEAGRKPGKMLSIVGLDLEVVKNICKDAGVEIANLNCPGQTVVSGASFSIDTAQKLAKERGAKLAVNLEVSGAFHSSFMQGAGVKLARELEKIRILTPKIPVISNVTGRVMSSPEEIKQNLIKQVSSSVLWEDSMRFVHGQGVKKFYEFGPGKVLKGLMRRIDSTVEVINIEKKEDIFGGQNAT